MISEDAKGRIARFLSGNGEASGSRKGDLTRRAKSLTPYEAALSDATTRAATGEWEDARPDAIVGLYALCHQRIYGVEAVELRAEFGIVLKRVRSLLHDEFHGDIDQFAQFVRWTWLREQRRRDRQRAPSDFRIGWRLQFSGSFLTDWRVATRAVR